MSAPEQRRNPVRAEAFGIALELPADFHIPGLRRGDHLRSGPATKVRHDALELRARWTGAEATCTREVRQDGRLLLEVDQDVNRGYLLQAPGIGNALISADGLEVICAPQPGETDWDALLVGQVLPLAATIRGLEAFHAAGVVRGGRSYLLCAPQGFGKTSLAVHLTTAGARLLSDDVVAVDDQLVAHPGPAILQVREPELRRISGRPTPGLRRAGAADGRARFVAEEPATAQPLGGIYLLERAPGGPAIEAEPVPSPFALLGATFNLSVRTPARLARHLECCARIAEQVPVFRARIVPGSSAAELAREIFAHLEARSTELV